MARGTRTVYPGERNKGLSSTFQPPEESQPKRWDKNGDKDEDNCPKNVNNVHNTSSQKYRQILKSFYCVETIAILLLNQISSYSFKKEITYKSLNYESFDHHHHVKCQNSSISNNSV